MGKHQPGRIEFTNHLMFNAVLTENEDLCIRFIEAVLDKHVESVEYLDDEHDIQPDLDSRGARLDILALVDGEYVDIEMQMAQEPDIERRCRFYHGAIATRFTPKGTGYANVPRSYVIFICLNDPLGRGIARYELATTCLNDASIPFDDGAMTILLNARAWKLERNSEVAGMLQYALTGEVEGSLAQDIAVAVESKNLDRKWVRASMGIMTYEHELQVLNRELERKRAEIEAARAQLDEATMRLDETSSRLDETTAQLDETSSRLDEATAQLDETSTRLGETTAQLDETSTRLDETTAQLDETTAQAAAAQAVTRLSKRLYEAGRGDEYFAALDNPVLLEALLAEFGEAK